MKKIILIACLFITFLLGSCKKFLQENPKSFISTSNFYVTEADAIAAVNASYAQIHGEFVRNDYFAVTDLLGEDVQDINNGDSWPELKYFSWSSTTPVLYRMWLNAFVSIAKANVVMNRIPPMSINEALKSRLLAEASFLRAFQYFKLVRWYGKVPLVLTETTTLGEYPARSEIKDVYEQIITDLKFAELNLDDTYAKTSNEYGRATKGAAKSLLAKVYLTMAGHPLNDISKFRLAADKAKEVIDERVKYGYDFMDNLTDVFDYKKETANKEAIWEKLGTSGLTGHYYTRMHTYFITSKTFKPSTSILNAYEASDIRKTAFFYKSGAEFLIGKYIDFEHGTDADNNYPFIRYTDVLLMYAETLIELGTASDLTAARDLINRIRLRAKASILTVTDQEGLRAAVRKERRLELCFEGHRWFDLVRWNSYLPTMLAANKNIKEFHDLYPVPDAEIKANPKLAPNNTGY